MDVPVDQVDGRVVEQHNFNHNHGFEHQINWSHVILLVLLLVAVVKFSDWDWGLDGENSQEEGGETGGVTTR
jgi:hypothetical protein